MTAHPQNNSGIPEPDNGKMHHRGTRTGDRDRMEKHTAETDKAAKSCGLSRADYQRAARVFCEIMSEYLTEPINPLVMYIAEIHLKERAQDAAADDSRTNARAIRGTATEATEARRERARAEIKHRAAEAG